MRSQATGCRKTAQSQQGQKRCMHEKSGNKIPFRAGLDTKSTRDEEGKEDEAEPDELSRW